MSRAASGPYRKSALWGQARALMKCHAAIKNKRQRASERAGCPLGALRGAVGVVAGWGGCPDLSTCGVLGSLGAPPWPLEPVGFGGARCEDGVAPCRP